MPAALGRNRRRFGPIPMPLHRYLGNPAYTGEQRCIACTVSNVVILSVAVGILAAVVRPALAIVVGLAGVVAIWLRGYVVPFTPEFAPRLVDWLPIPGAWFDSRSEPSSLADSTTISGEVIVERLAGNGVLVVEGDDLLLAAAFDARWREAMDSLADDPPDALARKATAVSGDGEVSVVRSNGQTWLSVDGRHTLLARPVAVAELAAVRALEPEIGDGSMRLAAAGPLRQFLTVCPVCESDLETASAVDCCGGHANPRSEPAERRVCSTCDRELWRAP